MDEKPKEMHREGVLVEDGTRHRAQNRNVSQNRPSGDTSCSAAEGREFSPLLSMVPMDAASNQDFNLQLLRFHLLIEAHGSTVRMKIFVQHSMDDPR